MRPSRELEAEIREKLDDLLNATATMGSMYEVMAEEGDKDAVRERATWSTIEDLRVVCLDLAGMVFRMAEITKLHEVEKRLKQK